jgi:hypothetical protein
MNTQGTLERLRAEFVEVPGLRLTVDQVRRLCGIEPTVCKTMLDALVDSQFLCVKSDGRYSRSTDGVSVRPRPARADGHSVTPSQQSSAA